MSFSIFWKKLGLYFNVETDDRTVVRAFFSNKPFFGSEECELKRALELYFRGEKVEFDVEVRLEVSNFVAKVLEVVAEIPYGSVKTYGEIASIVGTSPRAVGQALKRNPVPIIIPCHRVVAKNNIGGYSEGVEIKRALLELEGVRL